MSWKFTRRRLRNELDGEASYRERVKLVAAGRASEIFDLGDGRVLRRFRAGGDPEREALVMEHARHNGYPVPEVLDVSGGALVLELIPGPTMLAVLRRRLWTIRSHAALLADLHARLHEIAAPPSLEAAGPGDRLLHLDLHPDNIILSPAGAFVVDWTNARRGSPALDVALTLIILATAGGSLGRLFARSFLRHFDRDEIVDALPAAAERRIADPNVTDRERSFVRRFVATRGR
jgi:tRNA A-37 threonylcarbamoyl transferase component Bud32